MSTVIRTVGFRTEADNNTPVLMGNATTQPWTHISVNFYDENEVPVTDVTGVMSGEARVGDADKYIPFADTLDLAAGDRSWKPELGIVIDFKIAVTGLNPGYKYKLRFDKWGI